MEVAPIDVWQGELLYGVLPNEFEWNSKEQLTDGIYLILASTFDNVGIFIIINDSYSNNIPL